MRFMYIPVFIAFSSAILWSAPVAAGSGYADVFEPLAPFVGKTWRGAEDVEDSRHGDVIQKWEWILGGRAVRVTHANNGGAFGGQWTIFPDPETGGLRSHYVSTAGTFSEGTIVVEEGRLVHDMRVTGGAGIDRVKQAFLPQEGGSFITDTEYYLDGELVSGAPQFHYREAPNAELFIKPVE